MKKSKLKVRLKAKLKNRILKAFSILSLLAIVLLPHAGNLSAQTSTTTDMTTASTTGNMATTTMQNNATSTYTFMIMKHLCNSNVTNDAQFRALEASTSDELSAHLNVEYNCPTTALPGNNPSASSTIYSPRTIFNFQIQDNNGTTTNSIIKNLNVNGMFENHVLCENTVGRDINGNGNIASTTCLDASDYHIPVTATSSSLLTTVGTTTSSTATTTGAMFIVTESTQPSGYHFGEVRFTPQAIMANNDRQALVSTSTNGVMNFNLASDTDKMIMLHVYDFLNATSTGGNGGNNNGGGTGTTTATTTDNSVEIGRLRDLISNLQSQLDFIKTQIQMILNQLTNLNNNGGNGGNNNGGGTVATSTGARVRVNSTVAPIGDTDDFAGEHFGASEQVRMSFNGQILQTYTADKEGNFNTGSIVLPRTPGVATYIFRGLTTGQEIPVNITVTPLPY